MEPEPTGRLAAAIRSSELPKWSVTPGLALVMREAVLYHVSASRLSDAPAKSPDRHLRPAFPSWTELVVRS